MKQLLIIIKQSIENGYTHDADTDTFEPEMINEEYLYVFYNHTLWTISMADGLENLCGVSTSEDVKMRCQINGRTFFQSAFFAE